MTRLGIALLFAAACGTSDELFPSSDGGPGGSGAGSTTSKGGGGGGGAGGGDAGGGRKDAGGDAGQCPAGETWCQGCTPDSGFCTTGICGGVTQCAPVDAGTQDAGLPPGQCPAGQVWCPGCTPGSGECGTGGCPGYMCPPACAQATTAADCAATIGCHAVYYDPGTCDCAVSGCCTEFTLCPTAPGEGRLQRRVVGMPYRAAVLRVAWDVISYSGSCYEGCVLSTERAP